MKRGLVLCTVALAAMMSAARVASAQNNVLVSLDLFYADPDNPGTSAGAWQLMAKVTAGGAQGIAGLDTALTSTTGAADARFFAPTPAFKTTYDAKLWTQDQDGLATTLDMLFGQVPVASPGSQDLLYGAGVNTANPDELGVAVSTPANMNSAILLAVGRFNAGSTPAFVAAGTAANVFTAQGTPTSPPATGSIVSAAITTQVRSNVNTLSGDVNLDKSVGAADVGLLLPNNNTTNKIWQQGDINGDGAVGAADIGLLLPKLNQTHPAAAAASAVPEPASCVMAVVAMLGFGSIARRRNVA